MYQVSFNNKFFRVNAVISDKWGVDPLRDKIIPQLMEVTSYSIHEVVQDERGAPDLISLREYGADQYWWHIMAFNGICKYKDIVEGTTLRIPDIGSLIQITNDTVKASSSVSSIAII